MQAARIHHFSLEMLCFIRTLWNGVTEVLLHCGINFPDGNGKDALLFPLSAYRELAAPAGRAVVEHGVFFAAREPDARRIPRGKNRDTRRTRRSGKVHRPAVMTDHQCGPAQDCRTHPRGCRSA